MTLTLGIETSCDETSAAIVENGRVVRSNVVSSQVSLHAPFGGVVPEIASRQHIRAIVPVVERAMEDAEIDRTQIDAIAATQGPGLAGALLVGLTFARTLAEALRVPFTPVNHLEGHIQSVWLTRNMSPAAPPRFPLLTLIVSGGHTELVLVEDHGRYRNVGRTLDDAAGEAFDKVARLLGLPYPGGPAIQSAAAKATEPVRLPRARLPGTYDFSFSGLKTAVLHMVHAEVLGDGPNALRGRKLQQLDEVSGLSEPQVANIAAGFQESVADVLASKTIAAATEVNAQSLAVVGGVAANRRLREEITRLATIPVFVASPEFCTDNAAMIASAGYFIPRTADSAQVLPSLSLSTAGL